MKGWLNSPLVDVSRMAHQSAGGCARMCGSTVPVPNWVRTDAMLRLLDNAGNALALLFSGMGRLHSLGLALSEKVSHHLRFIKARSAHVCKFHPQNY